jgi:hypothetical protein
MIELTFCSSAPELSSLEKDLRRLIETAVGVQMADDCIQKITREEMIQQTKLCLESLGSTECKEILENLFNS